jgi:hypothetical protein
MTGPIVVEPGQGDAVAARGSLMLFKAVAATTGGAFSLHERHLPPGGLAHTFGNPGPAPARTLVLHTPAMDQYFRELQALWSGPTPPDRDAELALMRRHGHDPGVSSEITLG